jgi:hypothetical protein
VRHCAVTPGLSGQLCSRFFFHMPLVRVFTLNQAKATSSYLQRPVCLCVSWVWVCLLRVHPTHVVACDSLLCHEIMLSERPKSADFYDFTRGTVRSTARLSNCPRVCQKFRSQLHTKVFSEYRMFVFFARLLFLVGGLPLLLL